MNRSLDIDAGTSLAALGLRPGVIEALRGRGAWRVEDLSCMGRSTIAGLRGVGSETLSRLDAALSAAGLAWRSARASATCRHGDRARDAA